jgi:hypothetical protein
MNLASIKAGFQEKPRELCECFLADGTLAIDERPPAG